MAKDIPIWERGQEGGVTRPINRTKLYANLLEVCDVLTKCGIKHWLSHGTMLGAYRDNDLIAWDDDADIGLDLRDRSKIDTAITILRMRGYFIPPEGDRSKPISNTNMPWYDTVFIRDGEKIEGWWFERENEKEVYTYDRPRCGDDLCHDAKYYDNLQVFNFKNNPFFIPNYIEDWMVMMYSKDWKTPQKHRKYNNQKR